jgi:uncharacterized protein YggE
MITLSRIHSRLVLTWAFVAVPVLVLALALAAPRAARAQEASDQRASDRALLDVIVTTGEGTVRIAPDQAFVSITAESHARTPREAQRLNAEAMTAVQQKLKAAGFTGDAVRTLQLELQPQYDYSNGKQTLREYLARNSIEVRVEPVDRVGEITDLAVGSGATSVSNIRFELKDRGAVEHRALQEAVTQARGRADAIAQAANRAIDRIVRIDDQVQNEMPPPRPFMAMARAEAAPQAATPVAAGVLEIHARVVLTAKMR